MRHLTIEERNSIAVDMRPYAKRAAIRTARNHGLDSDDVEQTCMVKVIEKLDRVDVDEYPEPQGLAHLSIRDGVRSSIETHYSNKRQYERNASTIGEDHEAGEINPPSSRSEPDWILRKKLIDLRNKFTKTEASLLDTLYYGGAVNIDDAAHVAGIKPKTATTAHGKLLDKVRNIVSGKPIQKAKRGGNGKDMFLHCFTNTSTGETLRMTRADFAHHINGGSGPVSQLVNGKIKHYKGWSIKC